MRQHIQKVIEKFCKITQLYSAGFCVLEHVETIFSHYSMHQVDRLNYLWALVVQSLGIDQCLKEMTFEVSED